MIPLNDHLIIEPIKEGVIATEGNKYRVIRIPNPSSSIIFNFCFEDDIVFVEDIFVIRLNVNGKELFFVKIDNILAKIDGSKKDN